jgi:hypothetical protein
VIDDPNYLPRVTPVKPGMAPKMKVDPLSAGPSRTFRVTFSTGDELMSGMTEFAEKNNLRISEVRGLGGISSAVVSAYDPEKGAFKRFNIDQKGYWFHCKVRSRFKMANRPFTPTWSSCLWTVPCTEGI